MLLHSILSYLLVNSFYLLTAGSRKLELSISEEVKVLRSQQALLKVDGNTVRADQYLIRAEQDALKTDIEKVLKDQNQVQASQSNIKDEVVRSKSNQQKLVSDLKLIKADQEMMKALILNITGAQEKLENILPNLTAASAPQEPPTCGVDNKDNKEDKESKENKGDKEDKEDKDQEHISCINSTHEVLIPSYSNKSFTVPCDAKTQGGNWLILLRRINGSENFNRTWKEYKSGFGSQNGEFFLGLAMSHELLIELEDFEGAEKYEKYESFAIANETNFYRLTTLGAASGDAGDSLTYHLGMNFSSSDRDNDPSNSTNCAKHYSGGWWFNKCHKSNLMGTYNNTRLGKGINWDTWHGDKYSLKRAVMMIRSIFNK